MHSSRPDCVFGEARLISSTSTTFANTGPGPELEAGLALVVDVGADHVGGQQVGGALDARVLGVDRAGERPRERRLADARVVLDQHVPLGQQRDQHVAQHPLGSLDRARDVVAQPRAELGDLRRVELRDSRHSAPC